MAIAPLTTRNQIRKNALEEAARYLEALAESETETPVVECLLTAAEGIRKLKEGG